MLSGLFATGYTMALYRQNRFLKKLAATPIRKVTFVAAQVTARSLLVAIQVVVLVVIAATAFAAPFDALALAWSSVIVLLGLLTFMGAGFALACVITSEELIVDVISAVNLPLVLLSEIFFPLDALPRPLAVVGGMLPSTEMVRLLRQVLLYGVTDAAELGGGLGLLAFWAAVTFAVSLTVFRWHTP
jgi:ABC-2 type transport system permease protein